MKKFFITFLFQLSLFATHAQIIIDEDFTDWEDVKVAYQDKSNDGRNGIDFSELKIDNDSTYVYFEFNTGVHINLQNDNDIEIYIDIDKDIQTGKLINGIGADLTYFFGDRMGYYYLNGKKLPIFHTEIDLITLPTVSSDRFEMAIKRRMNIGSTNIEIGREIKVIINQNINGGDVIPDEMGGVHYVLNDSPYNELPYSLSKKNDTHLRVLSYNVERDQLFVNERPFRSIIPMIRPDILCFQEIYNHGSEEVSQLMENYFGGTWYHAKQGADIIIVSKYPIIKSVPIGGNGAFLIRKESEDILIINAHLYCCDADQDRQVEVDQIMEFLRESQNGRSSIQITKNTPILILGDMNFVGTANQRKTLIEGDIANENNYGRDFLPDWDGSHFEDAMPLTTGYPSTFTWSDNRSSYPKGRLDYVIYSGSVLQLENSYVLNTRGMSKNELHQLQLNASDTEEAADHLPVVTDFSFVSTSTVKNTVKDKKLNVINYYPNPVRGQLTIDIVSKDAGIAQWSIIDHLGNIVLTSNAQFDQGINKLYLNMEGLASGMYKIRIVQNGEEILIETVVQ